MGVPCVRLMDTHVNSYTDMPLEAHRQLEEEPLVLAQPDRSVPQSSEKSREGQECVLGSSVYSPGGGVGVPQLPGTG